MVFMAKNIAVIKALKKYQELIADLTPKIFSAFALALKEMGYDKDQIYDILSLTQEIWQQSTDKGIDLVKWCNDEVDIEMNRPINDKSKPGGGFNNG